EVLCDAESARHQTAPPAGATKSYRRAALARWITDTEHGAGQLAARVIVNRLWHHHFGVGIVATPNDFGFQGSPPSHPELLDYLARRLVDDGWRLKSLHKLIMTSAVYMQSSERDAERTAIDPDNRWLWRRSRRRLEAEAIRDGMLAVSGKLDATMLGPGTLDANMNRRSIYFFIKRTQLIPGMMLFDWPEHLVSIGRRASTTIAPQALMFMNSPQGRQYAADFAARLPADADQAIETAYRLAYSRPPSAAEQSSCRDFLDQQRQHYGPEHGEQAIALARRDFCQALLSANEFVYID
ncbi:MAG: DUF1553 domain-containing protein, partial [Planctomycetales bacterium]|nr:DUF1553 domain-containing protein [Planctomycetales bacterium]